MKNSRLTTNITTGWITLLLFFIFGVVQGQSLVYQVDAASQVRVDGTSTLHDWSSVVNEFEGTISFQKAFLKKVPKEGEAVDKVSLKFKVESMDGGRGSTMNGKIFKALKSEEHPYITFESTGAGKVTKVEGDKFTIQTPGNLSMAGITKPVTVALEGQKESNGKFVFKGDHKVNMRTFDIEPPSAMFGQIVTGEEITIVFDLVTNATAD